MGEKYVLEKVGFKVVYDPVFPITQTDFTQNVIAMRNAGVKILFLEQMPENYAGSLLTDLAQQNYHPQIIFGAAAYSTSWSRQPAARPTSTAPCSSRMPPSTSGRTARTSRRCRPSSTGSTWPPPGSTPTSSPSTAGCRGRAVHPGAAQCRVSDPSRGSLLEALSKITSFNGDHIVTTSDPAAKTTSNCYLIGRSPTATSSGSATHRSMARPTATVAITQYVTPPS